MTGLKRKGILVLGSVLCFAAVLGPVTAASVEAARPVAPDPQASHGGVGTAIDVLGLVKPDAAWHD